ncbi:ComEA family DNA-binding protein [Actinomyces sp. ZJ308]|uniref:ComEA family DNA-binding protein n=1 Tax=Actinomyces sp. ZJ308 TaxID=2708342 RepID=UPI001FBBF8E9|nr:ComEA family DNA-binding protein [Actinomyces sp. ZJ308]
MGVRRSSGNRSLDDLVRLACSADPEEPIHRPRRLAIAPRAAVVAGCVLLILAAVLALRAVLSSTDAGGEADRAAAAGASASIRTPATGPATAPATGPPSGAAKGPGAPAASGPAAGAGKVVVHVTGAVTRPGVVALEAGSRVADAINAAGGASSDADTEQLNLARVLSDGEQIRVPRNGEVLPEPAPQSAGPAGARTGSATGGPGGGSGAGTVNINTASASELEKLPGIGPALAQRIVEYRDSHGPFASVDALTDVPGIGQAKLEALREQATV